jgi:hypothetical protein
MTTLTIELNNMRAISVIKELEKLDLLRIVKRQVKRQNMADLLENSIDSKQAEIINQELNQMRNEWERVF